MMNFEVVLEYEERYTVEQASGPSIQQRREQWLVQAVSITRAVEQAVDDFVRQYNVEPTGVSAETT